MLPYVIINGVSSKTINGLLIQSLGPISKPKIRTNTEEIDGRDGDVVTKLGYSAYDRNIEIGLRGDYNIDDIISYFNTSGEIIFSDETNKYYNFAVYDTIDFERLIKYRTATVTLHIQPFKYDANEATRVLTPTDNGVILNIRNLGNIYSKPTLSITGKGYVTVTLNGYQIFLISDLDDKIIISAETMNAKDSDGNYLNRKVTGDYSNLKLKTGENVLQISSNNTLSRVSINKISRWV